MPSFKTRVVYTTVDIDVIILRTSICADLINTSNVVVQTLFVDIVSISFFLRFKQRQEILND